MTRELALRSPWLAADGACERLAKDRPIKRTPDRVALITGAARGLGHATAVRLAHEGARVCLLDRVSAAAAKSEVEALEVNGGM